MKKTNAQRQRAYRQRHLNDTDDDVEMLERINTMVRLTTKRSLERLAVHHGTTQRAVLERIIAEATNEVLDTLNPSQQTAFFERKPALRRNDQGAL